MAKHFPKKGGREKKEPIEENILSLDGYIRDEDHML